MGLLNQIAVNSFYRFVFIILQFLVTIFLSRLIGPDGLGIYSLILANVNIILIFSSLGIPAGITFHSAKKDLSDKALARIAIISAVIQFIVIAVAEYIFWLITGRFMIWPTTEPLLGGLGLIFFLSILVTERFAAFYNGKHKLKLFSVQQVIFSILMVLPLIYWLIMPARPVPYKVISFIIILSVLQMFSVAIVYSRLFSHSYALYVDPPGNTTAFFNYSMMAWLANSIQFLVYRIDFWILHYFQGSMELGLYALAVRIGQTFWIVPGLLSTIILPYMTSTAFNRNVLERMIRLTNSINILVAATIFLISYMAIPAIFGKAFTGSILPLMIMIPGILFVSMHTMIATYFAAKNKINHNLVTSLIALVLITLLDFLLIPTMGKTGAAIACTVAYSVSSVYALWLYSRMESYSPLRLLAERADRIWLERKVRDFFTTLKA